MGIATMTSCELWDSIERVRTHEIWLGRQIWLPTRKSTNPSNTKYIVMYMYLVRKRIARADLRFIADDRWNDSRSGQQDRRPPFAHLISRLDCLSVLIFTPWLGSHYVDDNLQRQTNPWRTSRAGLHSHAIVDATEDVSHRSQPVPIGREIEETSSPWRVGQWL